MIYFHPKFFYMNKQTFLRSLGNALDGIQSFLSPNAMDKNSY